MSGNQDQRSGESETAICLSKATHKTDKMTKKKTLERGGTMKRDDNRVEKKGTKEDERT